MAAVNLQEFQQQLKRGENVKGCLESLNALLVSNSSAEVALEVVSAVPLPLLFSCLQTDSAQQVQLACAVLDKLLCHLPASQLVTHGHYIELGLQYPGAKVATTCLQALLGVSERREIRELVLAPTMLHLVTQLITNKDLQCVTLATKLLLQYSTRPELLEGVLKGVWLVELGQLLTLSDIIRYQVYDLLVQTCVEGGPRCFSVIKDSGLLTTLIKDLESPDPLIKLNCIELLGTLSEMPAGMEFLQSSNVLQCLYESLSPQQDPMAALLIPGVLKFFGTVCVRAGGEAARLVEQYPYFLQFTLEAVLAPEDETLWGVAVDTFALLSSSQDGRSLLASQDHANQKVIKQLGKLIAGSAPSAVRCRALQAVSSMVSCAEDCTWQQSTSHQWFALAHPDLFKVLISIARQPFADLRLAVLGVLVEMAAWEWGQREMQRSPGFLEYLLDRNSEPDKEGKERKFEIVHRLVSSDCGDSVWGNVDMMKLRKYDREGPFYYTGDTTVALEGAT